MSFADSRPQPALHVAIEHLAARLRIEDVAGVEIVFAVKTTIGDAVNKVTTVLKNAPAKKAVKKAAKKSMAKKTAKKAPARKVAKKARAKKAVKKSVKKRVR